MPAIMAEMVGLNDITSTMWELTRFSFVVDYFIQVQDWLKQFKGGEIDIPYVILSEGYSRKRENLMTVTTEYNSEGSGPELWSIVDPPSRKVSGTVKYVRYERTKAPLPYGAIAYPTWSLPSLKQTITLSELYFMFNS
jgi:hypothetical protein